MKSPRFHCASVRSTAAVLLCLLALGQSACAPVESAPTTAPAGVVPTRIVESDGAWRFERAGQPYEVRGAGLEFGPMEALAAHGGNSFRTWRTDNGRMSGQEVLDRAHELGLTVAMCIEIGRERHGFDYDDREAVARQLAYARGEVEKYKDHPALLTWIIGNEPNLFYENPKVFDAVNDISRMIHEVDGNHPTTTALAGFSPELAQVIAERAPDLDFISIQMYGDIVHLPGILEASGYRGPYMVTEWGAIGHWEVPATSWGAPIEQNSSAKASSYLKAWETALAPDTRRLLGSYVFLWGQKQERTPTWYGMFLADGSETEVVDTMHYIWNGSWPHNRAPRVGRLTLDGRAAEADVRLAAGQPYTASIDAHDVDGDALVYHWEIMRESQAREEGGDKEAVPESLPGLVRPTAAGEAAVTAPAQSGAYRLFVYVRDGRGGAGHANLPFFVD